MISTINSYNLVTYMKKTFVIYFLVVFWYMNTDGQLFFFNMPCIYESFLVDLIILVW